MSGAHISDALPARLREIGDPARKLSAEAYFKGKATFLGVPAPQVKRLFVEARPQWKQLSPIERLGVALHWIDAELFEIQQLGFLALELEKKRLPAMIIELAEPIFDRRCNHWGYCDAFAGKLLRWRLPIEEDRTRLVGWAQQESPWRRRAACVAFVTVARRGLYGLEIALVADAALALDERFSQLGAGWLLRERWLAAPAEVEGYLRAKAPRMRREALRYAIEKMPRELQREFLSLSPRKHSVPLRTSEDAPNL